MKKIGVEMEGWWFTIVENDVIRDKGDIFQKPIEKLVYIVLCSFADKNNGESYPSIKTISQMCLCSDRMVRICIKRLEEIGLIERVHRKRDKARNDTNLYKITRVNNIQPVGEPDSASGGIIFREWVNGVQGEQESLEQEPIERDIKDIVPFKEIIDYLNEKTGKSYRVVSKNKDLIKARWNEGFSLDDFKKVIDIKTDEWLNDEKMAMYLRPPTLFGTKFESYLNQPVPKKGVRPSYEVDEGNSWFR